MNLSELLRGAARGRPDSAALHYGEESPVAAVTYRDFDRESDRVAHFLTGAGIGRGDRVAIVMHNIPQFAYAYFGILRAGAVAVPVNVLLTPREVRDVLADAGPSVVIAAQRFEDLVASALDGWDAPPRVVSTAAWDELGDPPEDVPEAEVDDDDLAVLAYTSGTTGEPKGAMLTHGNLRANLDQQMAIPDERVTSDDVLLLSLPLFHIYGLNVTLGLLVMNGATGILLERFEPVPVLRAAQDLGVTIMFGAPPMYVALCATPGADQYDLSSMRFAVSGAAPLDDEVLASFKNITGVDIFEGYGLSETGPTLTTNRMGPAPRPRSVGLPLDRVELRLVDPSGDDVERGDPGEVVVRGPNVFKGYWKRPELTEQAFLDDGWFRTGDIGVQDEEGYLYLVDRRRDLIIVSGFNVFPSEIEEALVADPKVEEAAAIGVPHPYTGEAVHAFVVLASGARSDEGELRTNLSARLARFKLPETIEIVDELPHLPTGKVARRALRTEGAPAGRA